MTSNFHREEITKQTFRALALRLGELHRTWSFYVVISQRRANELSKIKTALVRRVERGEVIPNQLINYAANKSCIFVTFLNFPLLIQNAVRRVWMAVKALLGLFFLLYIYPVSYTHLTLPTKLEV